MPHKRDMFEEVILGYRSSSACVCEEVIKGQYHLWYSKRMSVVLQWDHRVHVAYKFLSAYNPSSYFYRNHCSKPKLTLLPFFPEYAPWRTSTMETLCQEVLL